MGREFDLIKLNRHEDPLKMLTNFWLTNALHLLFQRSQKPFRQRPIQSLWHHDEQSWKWSKWFWTL